MKVYKYRTKISQEGEILIPLDPALYNKEVDVIILQKEKLRKKDLTAKDFIDKWAGFLKNSDPDKSRFDYLSDKYK
jgi:hypothetical protein